MTIENYSFYYLPILKELAKGNSLHRLELVDAVAKQVGLSGEERYQANPRGTVIFESRVHWATQYLVMAHALHRPSRGQIQITERGKTLIAAHPLGFGDSVLEEFEELKNWLDKTKSQQAAARTARSEVPSAAETGVSPEEQISNSMDEIESAVASELVQQVLNQPPVFLEKLVLKLLHAMGYGDSEDDLTHTGQSGDEGVDGFIKQDRLGIQNLYVQAKRYAPGNTVGRPAIQAFVGAIAEKANSGVFITTSSFSKDAVEYANAQKATRVILIDGPKLGRLLVDYEIGVRVKRVHKYLEVDEDFFSE